MQSNEKLSIEDLEFISRKVLIKESSGDMQSFKMISVVARSDEKGSLQVSWECEDSNGNKFQTKDPVLLINEYNRISF